MGGHWFDLDPLMTMRIEDNVGCVAPHHEGESND